MLFVPLTEKLITNRYFSLIIYLHKSSKYLIFSLIVKQIQGLAKQLDWTERKVERWIRLKTAQNRPTVLSKFTESAYVLIELKSYQNLN
jgi:hypothetical protein